MRSLFVGALVVGLAVTFTHAGRIERELEARWRGAHVVLEVESRSHCNGRYSDNRINGRFSQGTGDQRFEAGELGHVENLDVKRSRVDVLVDISEPILVGYAAGPFTLYDERTCKVELEIEVPRELVREDDIDAIDELMQQTMDRFVTLDEALASDLWNGRERAEYPPDYEETLFAYEVWKVEQHNLAVEALLAESDAVLGAVSAAISSDRHYVEGFADGVESSRPSTATAACDGVVTLNLGRPYVKPPRHLGGDDEAQWRRGYADGYLLVRALHLRETLPGCFLEPPSAPRSASAADQGKPSPVPNALLNGER
jgi:hypothetical protein